MAIYGNVVRGYWRVYLNYSINNNYSPAQASVTYNYGIYWGASVKGNNDTDGNYQTQYDRPSYVSCDGKLNYNYPTVRLTKTWYSNGGRAYQYGSGTFYVNKTASARNVTITASIYHNSSSTTYSGTSAVSATLSVSALPTYTISFDGNTTDTVTVPANITKTHGINITLPSDKPTRTYWEFGYWNTKADGTGTTYQSGGTFNGNANTTLYAIWQYVSPNIYNIVADRVDSSHNPDDEGTYLRLKFSYVRGHTPSGTYASSTSVSVSCGGGTGSITLTANFGTTTIYFSISSTTTAQSYPITISATETGHTAVTFTGELPSSLYPIDLKSDATLMTFGVPTGMKDAHYYLLDENDGGTDEDLYDAIVALGWDSDVLQDSMVDVKKLLTKMLNRM